MTKYTKADDVLLLKLRRAVASHLYRDSGGPMEINPADLTRLLDLLDTPQVPPVTGFSYTKRDRK